MPDSVPMRPVETQEKEDSDWKSTAMTWTVGLGAAILSWAAWTGLAQRCGWTETLHLGSKDSGLTLRLAWLTAIIVDIYALRAFRVWQRSAPWVSDATRYYAKWSTFVAIGVGVAGNVAYHMMILNNVAQAPWWIVIPVSALAPMALGAVGHLNAIERRDRATWRRKQAETPVPETRKRTMRPTVSSETHDRINAHMKVSVSPEIAVETRGTRETQSEEKVSGLTETLTAHLEAIKSHVGDWDKRGGKVSYAEITEATGITGKRTLVNLRAAMIQEAKGLTVPDYPRDLVNAL